MGRGRVCCRDLKYSVPCGAFPAAQRGLSSRIECCPEWSRGDQFLKHTLHMCLGQEAGPNFPTSFGGGHKPNLIIFCGEWRAIFPALLAPCKGVLFPQRQNAFESTEQPALGDQQLLSIGRKEVWFLHLKSAISLRN